MSGGRILVASPYAADASRGNSVSARRIEGILAELEYQPELVEGAASGNHDFLGSDELPPLAMIALHARKSAPAIRAFREEYPSRSLVVLLTGSDLYADLLQDGEERASALESMRQADRLVVCQDESLNDIPEMFRHKASVVPKSVDVPLSNWLRPASQSPFHVLIASHLRPVKDPLLVAEAVDLLPTDSEVMVTHYGNAEDARLGKAVEEAAARLGAQRYRWMGQVARHEVVSALAQAHVALNTSKVEGGANALCEALVAGIPCVASAIPANVGMLGEGHPGLFPAGDAGALAEVLHRAESDDAFYQSLMRASQERGPMFTRSAERASWGALLAELSTA